MEILTAFILILVSSLIIGVLLSLCSHFFAVKEDPKKIQIRECLPGINCGACGYKGCDDYADALAKGESKPNLCVPGAQGVADTIGDILGIEAEPFVDVVAFVACNGTCGATENNVEYEGVHSCRAAAMTYGGASKCKYGCMGFGDCAATCPSGAICFDSGVARVDTSLCLGCGMCVETCPKHIITMVSQYTKTIVVCNNKQKGADARKVCTNACIGCKKCEKTCPSEAIAVIDNLAVIDYDKCTNCADCVKECPTGCLKTVFFPDLSDDVVITKE